MSDYTANFNGAAKDSADADILGSEFDTEFGRVQTSNNTKTDKATPSTPNSIALLNASGNLADGGETIAENHSFAKRESIYLVADADDIDFTTSPDLISSTTTDLSVFLIGDVITVTGTTNNNTDYTVTASASDELSISETATAELGETPTFSTTGAVQVLDEDDFASNSATAVASQQSINAFIGTSTRTIDYTTGITNYFNDNTLQTINTVEVPAGSLQSADSTYNRIIKVVILGSISGATGAIDYDFHLLFGSTTVARVNYDNPSNIAVYPFIWEINIIADDDQNKQTCISNLQTSNTNDTNADGFTVFDGSSAGGTNNLITVHNTVTEDADTANDIIFKFQAVGTAVASRGVTVNHMRIEVI
jgi:hypothetical protein